MPAPNPQQVQAEFIRKVQQELGIEEQDDLDLTLAQLKNLKQRIQQHKKILSEIHERVQVPFEVYSALL